MKPNLTTPILLVAFLTSSAAARDLTTPSPVNFGPPDKEKLSYAQGMHIAMELKPAGVEFDPDAIARGIKDVLEGKPTQLTDSEVATLLKEVKINGVPGYALQDKQKVSYAIGMHRGLQLKSAMAEVDPKVIEQGLKDKMSGKPTRIQESEVEPLFRDARMYGFTQQSKKNKAEGEAFLAKNAKESGIKVLPDGLQYRVLKQGEGEMPKISDLLFVKYRGSFIDGKQFDQKEHFLTPSTGGPKGWQDVLQQMKVGSKWQIFVPADLAFGKYGEAVHGVGPDTTLIYELELLSIAQPGDPGIGTGRVGHGLDDGVPQPTTAK